MGSSNSSRRRRRMSDRVDVGSREASYGHVVQGAEGVDSDSEEEHDLPAILAYLIRSGQVRILTSDNNGESFSDDEDSEICGPARSPPIDPHPDTSNIEKNDIKQQILQQSGRYRTKSKKCDPTVTHMLFNRQTGMGGTKQFCAGHRKVMCTPFLPNHMEPVDNYRNKAFCGTYSKEGNIFLSAAQDQYIRIYDTSKGNFELMKAIRARDVGWSILDTAFSPDGNFMIYSSWSDCIHLCNVYGDTDVHQALPLCPQESSFCIFSLTFSSDNKEIMGGANNGCLYVYDRDSNQRVLRLDAHDDDVNAVSFADGSSQILFSGGDDGLCKMWDRRTLKEENPVPVGIMAGHHDGITYIDSKGDARYFLSNSKDQTVKLWDVRVPSKSQAIDSTKKAVSKQRWDYRWQQVPRKMAKNKRLEGDTSVMTYRGHSVLNTLIRCHFSPDYSTGQRYIYTGCATGCVVIYDLLTGKIIKKLDGHKSCVRDVSWHPYDNVIISTSWDGTLGKWEYVHPGDPEDSDESEEEIDEETGARRSTRLKKKRKKKRHITTCNVALKLFD